MHRENQIRPSPLQVGHRPSLTKLKLDRDIKSSYRWCSSPQSRDNPIALYDSQHGNLPLDFWVRMMSMAVVIAVAMVFHSDLPFQRATELWLSAKTGHLRSARKVQLHDLQESWMRKAWGERTAHRAHGRMQ